MKKEYRDLKNYLGIANLYNSFPIPNIKLNKYKNFLKNETTISSMQQPSNLVKKKKTEQKLSKLRSHLFRRKILHPSRHAVPKHGEIPGRKRR